LDRSRYTTGPFSRYIDCREKATLGAVADLAGLPLRPTFRSQGAEKVGRRSKRHLSLKGTENPNYRRKQLILFIFDKLDEIWRLGRISTGCGRRSG
jgi:hypothetical protein